MQPDVKQEVRAGWAVLAATLVIGGGILWWFTSDDGLEAQVENARVQHAKLVGREPLAARVEKQAQANQEMSATVEDLKKNTRFTVSRRFTILPEDTVRDDPGGIFQHRFIEVRQEIMDLRNKRSVTQNEDIDLGFPKGGKPPPDNQAQLMMTMLQLTRRATRIALETPTPIFRFKISNGVTGSRTTSESSLLTGPSNRPPLLREYPLTLDVTATLSDILWILHAFSQTPEEIKDADDPGEYPLVLQGLTINSSVTSEDQALKGDAIQLLHAVFHIAGMQFVPQDQRAGGGAVATATPAGGRLGTRATQTGPATSSAMARP